jgi:hypothetical protein
VIAIVVLNCVAAFSIAACDGERRTDRADAPASFARGAGSPNASGPADRAQAPQPAARFCLELQGPRSKVQLGEPATLVASLVNCSSSPQEAQDLLSPEFGFLHVWIRSPDGEETSHRPLVRREARGIRARTLAPGERFSTFVPVYFGPDGWTLTVPGEYRVRAEYSFENLSAAAAPVTVTVAAPETAADRRAASLFMSRDVGLFLATGRDNGGRASAKLETVAKELGSSRLASYARLSLAIDRNRGRFDPATKTFQSAACDGTLADFERLVPAVSDPQLAATGASAWVRCLGQLGKSTDVRRATEVFYRAHPAARTVPAVAESLQATPGKERR